MSIFAYLRLLAVTRTWIFLVGTVGTLTAAQLGSWAAGQDPIVGPSKTCTVRLELSVQARQNEVKYHILTSFDVEHGGNRGTNTPCIKSKARTALQRISGGFYKTSYIFQPLTQSSLATSSSSACKISTKTRAGSRLGGNSYQTQRT